MKKAMSVLAAVILVLCMSGAALAEGTVYHVGICQLVQHVALDAATQGFQDALTEKLGDAVIFDVQNASGDSNTCSTIMNTFVSNNVDLIMANATPALQAAVAATGGIPVLGTSVTDYATALDMFPAPLTWHRWTSRRICCRSFSRKPGRSASSTVLQNRTASTRRM